MYAIIEVGAKQYPVKKGEIIEVEKQPVPEGSEIILTNVLLVADEDKVEVGFPYLQGAKVKALALKEIRGKKAVSYKYRRRKDWHWKKGHRQALTRIEIKDILFS